MKIVLMTAIMTMLVFGSASARQHHKHYRAATTGQEQSSFGQPQSPLSYSSGAVTHSDEQARGLVPGSTNADGGMFRNLGN